jgi:hypothetical protein
MDINILSETYKELLPECICKNYDNRPYMLKVTAKKWALDEAMKRCGDCIDKDPIDILTGYLWDLMILKMDCTTDDAKLVFGSACKLVQELIDILEYKSKL